MSTSSALDTEPAVLPTVEPEVAPPRNALGLDEETYKFLETGLASLKVDKALEAVPGKVTGPDKVAEEAREHDSEVPVMPPAPLLKPSMTLVDDPAKSPTLDDEAEPRDADTDTTGSSQSSPRTAHSEVEIGTGHKTANGSVASDISDDGSVPAAPPASPHGAYSQLSVEAQPDVDVHVVGQRLAFESQISDLRRLSTDAPPGEVHTIKDWLSGHNFDDHLTAEIDRICLSPSSAAWALTETSPDKRVRFE